MILLFIEKKKNTKYGSIVFLSQNCIPNSNLKQWYFYCAQRIHNRLKMSNKYYQGQTQKKKKKKIIGGKPLLHGINLRKSPVKNRNTFIFDWVII